MTVELKIYENFNLQENIGGNGFPFEFGSLNIQLSSNEITTHGRVAFSYASALSNITDYSQIHSSNSYSDITLEDWRNSFKVSDNNQEVIFSDLSGNTWKFKGKFLVSGSLGHGEFNAWSFGFYAYINWDSNIDTIQKINSKGQLDFELSIEKGENINDLLYQPFLEEIGRNNQSWDSFFVSSFDDLEISQFDDSSFERTFFGTLISGRGIVDEGDFNEINVELSNPNLIEGTPIYWSIVGENITKEDFNQLGSLDGIGYVNSEGVYNLSIEVKKDSLKEGEESLEIKFFLDESRTQRIASREYFSSYKAETGDSRFNETTPYIDNPIIYNSPKFLIRDTSVPLLLDMANDKDAESEITPEPEPEIPELEEAEADPVEVVFYNKDTKETFTGDEMEGRIVWSLINPGDEGYADYEHPAYHNANTDAVLENKDGSEYVDKEGTWVLVELRGGREGLDLPPKLPPIAEEASLIPEIPEPEPEPEPTVDQADEYEKESNKTSTDEDDIEKLVAENERENTSEIFESCVRSEGEDSINVCRDTAESAYSSQEAMNAGDIDSELEVNVPIKPIDKNEKESNKTSTDEDDIEKLVAENERENTSEIFESCVRSEGEDSINVCRDTAESAYSSQGAMNAEDIDSELEVNVPIKPINKNDNGLPETSDSNLESNSDDLICHCDPEPSLDKPGNGSKINNVPTGITIGENPKNPEKLFDTTATTLTNVYYKYLFSIDIDINDYHTYSFISGEGDKDNELLRIDNESGAIALYTEMKALPVGELTEDQKDYHIRLKTTDKNGSSYENSYVINFSNNTFIEIDKKTSPVSELDPIEEVTEPYQTVSAFSDEISFYPGKDINFDLVYTTSDNESALTGLGLKVHYDSTIFTPSGENNGVSALVDTFGDPTVIDDTDNFDNDDTTDKYLAITWTDFMGNFPGGDLPATLASLAFSSSESGVDSLTGESKESKINFTSTDPTQNYNFLSQSVTLKPQSFNLDVDGDGSVTALGDGLMVIRKIFGAALAGDALTSKALSTNATRTTDEIHEFIQTGIDEKVLDVDGDGSVTALGDGLMVIRKLFGAAFAGDALTDKALSTNATRTTDEIHDYIAAMSDIGSLV